MTDQNSIDSVTEQYLEDLAAAVVPDYFLVEQFCNNGVASTDYIIPPKSSGDLAAASLDTGAPPLQQVKPSLGGAVFPRAQYNGILRLISNIVAYLNKGNNFTFDTKNAAGYASGAVLWDYATNKYVVSLKNSNVANFVTNPSLINNVDWGFVSVNPNGANAFAVSPTVPTPAITDATTKSANMAAINQAVTGYTNIDVSAAVGGVLTVTEAQYRLQWIRFNGTLTGDLIIEFPQLNGKAIILSNSVVMGNYNILMRVVGQATATPLYGGISSWVLAVTSINRLSTLTGTSQYGNCYYNYDIATNDNSNRLANTAFVQAVAALKAPLASPALTGVPTAPTAPTGTNTTQLATMAALYNATNPNRMAYFAADGTFTVPAGITSIYVTASAGGGGGGGNIGGGTNGTATSLSSLVTLGGGGGGQVYMAAGGLGGSSLMAGGQGSDGVNGLAIGGKGGGPWGGAGRSSTQLEGSAKAGSLGSGGGGTGQYGQGAGGGGSGEYIQCSQRTVTPLSTIAITIGTGGTGGAGLLGYTGGNGGNGFVLIQW